MLQLERRSVRPELWLAPLTDSRDHGSCKDLRIIFSFLRLELPWQSTLRRVNVFKIYPQFPNLASPTELRQLIDFLKAHNIRLAMEFGVLTAGAACGQKVESYGGQYLRGAAKKIKEAGGTLDTWRWTNRCGSVDISAVLTRATPILPNWPKMRLEI